MTLASCTSSNCVEMTETALNFLRSWRTFLMVLVEVEESCLG